MIGFLQIATLVAIVLNGLDLSFGMLHLNSERVLLPFVIVALAIKFLSKDHLYTSPPLRYYLGFGVCVMLSTLIAGVGDHINGLIVTLAPLFYFLLFMQPGLSRRALGQAFEGALWYLAIGSIAAVVLISKFQYSFSLVPNAIDPSGRAGLTMMEPNILGSTLGAFMVIHIAFCRYSIRQVVLMILALTALVLTGSKVPYAAFLGGIVFLLVRSGVWRGATPILLTMVGVVIVAIAGTLFSGKLYDFYVAMLDRPDAVTNRMYSLVIGWQRFLEHPIFGNGPLDFAHYNQTILTWMGSDNARNMWIWQIWVAVLHDEGLVGFTLFILFLLACWRRGQQMVRLGHKEFIGYLAAMLAMIISDQTTTTHLSAIFGVLLGLVCSSPLTARVARRVIRRRAVMVGATGMRIA